MELRLKLGEVFWRKILRPYLFGKEAEDAHLFTIKTLRKLQTLHMLWVLKLLYRSPLYQMPTRALGILWRNPIGLAAGFDKHAEVVPALEALGFGSVEIGTATPEPQEGNSRPRVFRNQEFLAVLNRYGFNSVGAREVAKRLTSVHQHFRIEMPIGVSIGKNKDTPDAEAVKDYIKAYDILRQAIRPDKDWVKINISSPNTPGLREIFERLDEFLDEFMEAARKMPAGNWSLREKPLPKFIIKVPPDDLSDAQLKRVVEIAANHGFSGIEATNTTTNKIIKARCGWAGEAGGVSGEPLRKLAISTLSAMKDAAARKSIDLVAVGGISEGWHALRRRELGAKAVQVYTGLVFRGPTLIHEVLEAWK